MMRFSTSRNLHRGRVWKGLTTQGGEIVPFLKLRKTAELGKPLVWQATIKDSTATVSWGREEGKQQQVTRTVFEGKQKRTNQEQLELELRSIAKKKIQKDGYSLVIGSLTDDDDAVKLGSNSDDIKVPMPMLAKQWKDRPKSHNALVNNVYIQPKLDGLRCIADLRTGHLYSRARKRFEGLQHIEDEISRLGQTGALARAAVRYVDGEVYSHGMGFQQITSRARRTENLHQGSLELKLHLFDLISETVFGERLAQLQDSFQSEKSWSSLKLCPTGIVSSIEALDLERSEKHWREQGYEGVMIRLDLAKGGGYRPGQRSSALFKYKTFEQEEFQVIAFQKHRELDTLGSVLLGMPNGESFSATPAEDNITKQELWRNRSEYLKPGYVATIQYQEKSSKGIPRFPVLVGLRHEHDR